MKRVSRVKLMQMIFENKNEVLRSYIAISWEQIAADSET
jgi:hypothetical protein